LQRAYSTINSPLPSGSLQIKILGYGDGSQDPQDYQNRDYFNQRKTFFIPKHNFIFPPVSVIQFKITFLHYN
jgi:hypothetical protein